MSGHSKFANIKHKKEKNDAAKGKIFTIIGREIAVAVKEGGPDPANNFKLAQVIAKAKSNNMPNDTIERGIKKAAGDGNSVNYEFCTYEGYGPSGTAIIVKCLTDNKNRTASNVRSAFTKGNGNIGTPGCVSFMFDKKGQILIDREEFEMDADELMMLALDAGAEDFAEEEDSFEIITDPDSFSEVREKLEEAGIPMMEASVTMIPQTYVELTDETDIKNILTACENTEKLLLANKNHAEKDIAFHTAIALSSKNIVVPKLVPIINSSIPLIRESAKFTMRDETIEIHREIADAIAAHDAVRAHDAMYLHLIYNRKHIKSIN